ncbi:MAG: DUF4912 domain-containing protein [Verrucomicrobia bacterium]|nr:DUF4912 domain-containing protein [Verrucomicrobiota bacterium]
MSEEPNQREQREQSSKTEPSDQAGVEDGSGSHAKTEDLGELPSGYGDMFVIARDPHWLYTYWDFDYSQFPRQRQLYLQVFKGEALESAIPINELARNWYIPVQHANTDYRVVFGFEDAEGNWRPVGETGQAHTPPESISTQWDTLFATVPFHLTFNLLVEVIEAAKATGEPLAEALARLQQAAAAGGQSPRWGATQLKILETLLGGDLLARLSSMSSSELGGFLQTDLSTHPGSAETSELLAKSRLARMLLPPESSLFSGFLQSALSSESVSSLAAGSSGAEFSGGLAAGSEARLQASEILSSWRSALGSESLLGKVSSAEFLSQLSSLGLSSAELVSALNSAGLSSAELLTALSSAGLSSAEFASALSSAGLSSAEFFSQFGISLAELSSLGLSSFELSSAGISSEKLSALQAAALESGALSSETLSSGLSASWTGLEFGPSSWSQLYSESSLASGFGASWGESFGLTQREFFMHVNAEVIFYGGTHPDARVTVGGQPIQLQPDGSFRYHFIFPDKEFEIPIVAVSPDGKETRSAVLSFRRETSRQGDVGHTAQPPFLSEPMGARS